MPDDLPGPPSPGDDHLQPALARALGVVHQAFGGAMRGHDPHLVRNIQMFKHINGMAHGLPVRLAAHDDAHQRLFLALWHEIPAPKKEAAL